MPVFIAKESKGIKNAIREILDFFDRQIDPSRGFFLKPNIVFPVSPDSGEITRPLVVGTLIETLREKYGSVDIVIGEGTAAGTVPAENFEVSGYRSLADDLSVPLIDLDQAERVEVPWKYGTLSLPRIALERCYINLPILKSSSAALFSGAIKNQKGLLSPGMKKNFHLMGLHGPLAALTQAVKPELTILDGINFLKEENVLVGGDCVVEVDAVGMRLLNSEEPEYFAALRKMGYADGKAEICGEAFLKCRSERHKAERYKSFMNMRLWSNPRACSMCRGVFQGVRRFPSELSGLRLMLYAKLVLCSLRGVDFVFGKNPQFDHGARRVVCIGNCTKNLARQEGYRHIPGCPPGWKDLARCL